MLDVRIGERHWRVQPNQAFVIGREPGCDAVLQGAGVSRHHLTLRYVNGAVEAADTSTNGTFVSGHRITRPILTLPVTLRLGHITDGIEVHLSTAVVGQAPPRIPPPVQQLPPTHGAPSQIYQVGGSVFRIGRLADNDLVLTDLPVSRRHAELRKHPNGWLLVDLNSPNGTFVNGQRVGEAWIGPDDVIGIGRHLLRLVGERLEEYVDTGEGQFAAHDLVVEIGGKRILDGIGFTLPGRSFLAVVGPSGAGKSTLLGALTGFRPADTGGVTYSGRDLYSDYDELRQRIGLVPQDDILHPQLTVLRALRFAAKLRFPEEVSAAERERRINEVLAQLGLTAHANQRIDSLSGGQRKRTSVALELLTKPSLLFLDEPTSGLDPGLDKSVMQTLRALADDGRTVVVVTHSVSHLDSCDRVLVLAAGGRVAYFGPPSEVLEYFGQRDYADVFLALDQNREYDWTSRYRASPHFARYGAPPGHVPAVRPPQVPSLAPRQQRPLRQFGVLFRRYLAVIAADRQYTAFLLALPFVLSLLAQAVPSESGLSVQQALASTKPGQPAQLLLVLILGGALMGSAASVRELVKDRAIYRRERAIGLTIRAYLASKLAVLSMVAVTQAVLLAVVGGLGRPAPDDAVMLSSSQLEIVAAVVAVTLVSMVIGLAISALIDNADRGMPLLVMFVMAQLILCGGLFPVGDRPGLAQLSWLVPGRWGFAMGSSTMDLNQVKTRGGDPTDGLWDHEPAVWIADVVLLGALATVVAIGCGYLLQRLDPSSRTTNRTVGGL